ncbi:hypothetical protein Plo01_72810 [Planobispora longispora]|uniref:Uncharacterized protein n=1 Tax=Planobispora longispora TaxID=28887 RepID=A0A8J3W9J0_9ACTN|nr:hypothetical protein Plo01_72810 [Planobispora longispora]
MAAQEHPDLRQESARSASTPVPRARFPAAPHHPVTGVIDRLRRDGPVRVTERVVTAETVHSSLPRQSRPEETESP